MEEGKNKCFFCGGDVVLTGTDMANDIYEDCGENDILYYFTCSSCGAEYEAIQYQDVPKNCIGETIDERRKYFGDDEKD